MFVFRVIEKSANGQREARNFQIADHYSVMRVTEENTPTIAERMGLTLDRAIERLTQQPPTFAVIFTGSEYIELVEDADDATHEYYIMTDRGKNFEKISK